MNDTQWRVELLGDLAAPEDGAIAIGPFGSSMKSDLYVHEGVPVVRGTNLNGQPGFRGDFVFVDQDTATRFSRCILEPGDLVFPHRGAIGSVGIAVDAPPGRWLMSTSMMRFRANRDIIEPLFAFHFFRSPQGRHQLLKNASQVGTPGIGQPLASLRACEIPVPPIAEQRAIAGVLGALDDKIEQNRRTARALEGLARAIFRAWFVDFEPVKAKAAGAAAFPSMPRPVFDTLPIRFTDSVIGPVPEGWDVKALSACVHLTMGQSPPSEHYNQSGDGLPFHQGVTDYGFRFPTHRVYCTVENRTAEALDVLLSVRAPVGRINVADRRLVLGRGLAGLRHVRDLQSFLLHQLAHVFAEEDAVGDGTIYKAVTKQFLSGMLLLSPAEDAQSAFEAIARPLDDLVASSEVESRRLASIRDYLLPKLMRGDIRVEADHG
jgi:type I restriction enzyme, S subunit